MKNFIIFCIVFVFCSCATSRITTKHEYLSLVEIKFEYNLTNKQCRQIVKDAKSGQINIIYHAGRDQWMYPTDIDYSKYKTE